jgi:hypothetical protein
VLIVGGIQSAIYLWCFLLLEGFGRSNHYRKNQTNRVIGVLPSWYNIRKYTISHLPRTYVIKSPTSHNLGKTWASYRCSYTNHIYAQDTWPKHMLAQITILPSNELHLVRQCKIICSTNGQSLVTPILSRKKIKKILSRNYMQITITQV